MFQILVPAIGIAASLFLVYLLVRAYRPSWFCIVPKETFIARPAATGPPVPAKVNTPMAPVPAPAPPVRADPVQEPRVVASGGPATPNMQAPADTPAAMSPEAKPIDPYDDRNMEAPIRESMRHPELSFGPGVDNTGMNKLATSGVANTKALSAESPFSPEFAQNGGEFMGSVFANDLTKDDRYSMI